MAIIDSDIFLAKKLLEKGHVIAIPTETVYGLAANAYNDTSVSKIFEIKKRPKTNPLIVHVSSIDQVINIVEEFPYAAKKLAAYFWPGPLTLLLPKNNSISDLVTASHDKVAVRIPSHPIALQLLKILSFPLVAPSANPFGYISPTLAAHVQQQLGECIPYILDGGACSVGIESTIVGFENGKIIVYRLGGVSVEMIQQVLQEKVEFQTNISSGFTTVTPGSLLQHYSPGKPFMIGSVLDLINVHNSKKIGILAFDKYYEGIDKAWQVMLTPSGNMQEAAYNLFAALRKLDQLPIEMIVSSYVSDTGLGKAINDRLWRASTNK